MTNIAGGIVNIKKIPVQPKDLPAPTGEVWHLLACSDIPNHVLNMQAKNPSIIRSA